MGKSSKIIIGIIIFILVLIISFFLFKYEAGEYETGENKKTEEPKICCKNTCFNLEIADSPESYQLGLMYRESLGDNEGMLFVFKKPGIYSFWMKNTLIPLAGIRLDTNLKIVDIMSMDPCKSEPCTSYKPQAEAQYVLEINQGLISKKGLLHIGDKCELKDYK